MFKFLRNILNKKTETKISTNNISFIREGSKVRIPALNLEGYVIKTKIKNGRAQYVAICNINLYVPSISGNLQRDVDMAISNYSSRSRILRNEIRATILSGVDESGIKLLSKRELNTIRFAVGAPNNIRSWIWRMLVQGDQVYLGAENALDVFKVSLHDSNTAILPDNRRLPWKIVFDKKIKSNRIIKEWEKPDEFAPGWTPSIGILIPSIDAERPFKKTVVTDPNIEWFAPPVEGNKLIFKVLFSKSGFSEEELKTVTIPGDQLVGKLTKKNGEIVWLLVREDALTAIEIGKIKDVMEKTKIHLKLGSSEDSLNDSRALLVVSEDRPTISTQPTILDIPLGKENLDIPLS